VVVAEAEVEVMEEAEVEEAEEAEEEVAGAAAARHARPRCPPRGST
jgi:hypothetical protein